MIRDLTTNGPLHDLYCKQDLICVTIHYINTHSRPRRLNPSRLNAFWIDGAVPYSPSFSSHLTSPLCTATSTFCILSFPLFPFLSACAPSFSPGDSCPPPSQLTHLSVLTSIYSANPISSFPSFHNLIPLRLSLPNPSSKQRSSALTLDSASTQITPYAPEKAARPCPQPSAAGRPHASAATSTRYPLTSHISHFISSFTCFAFSFFSTRLGTQCTSLISFLSFL